MRTRVEPSDELHDYSQRTVVVNNHNSEVDCEFYNKARDKSEYLVARKYDADFILMLKTWRSFQANSIEFLFKNTDTPLYINLRNEYLSFEKKPYLKFSRPIKPWALQRLLYQEIAVIMIHSANETIKYKPLGAFGEIFKEVWETLYNESVEI